MSVLDGNPIHVEVSTTDGESKGASISNPVKVESASQPITVKSVTNGESEGVSVLDGELVLNPTSALASLAIDVLVQLSMRWRPFEKLLGICYLVCCMVREERKILLSGGI